MKLPRDLSGSEVVRALLRLGFIKERQVGSHVRLSRGGLRVTVPVPGVVAVGTLKSILRQAEVTVEQLLAEC